MRFISVILFIFFISFSRDNIWSKLSSKQQSSPTPKETAIVTPLPPKKQEPSRIPMVEPSKSRTPSPQPPKTTPVPTNSKPFPPVTSPTPPVVPTSTIRKDPPTPTTPPARSLEPPPKPPRSPSPHPIRAEAFEEVDIDEDEDDEEDEEGEEGSDVEDEENSVISASPRRAPVANSVNDFINQEINSQKQTR